MGPSGEREGGEGDLRPSIVFMFCLFLVLDIAAAFDIDSRHQRRPSLGGARALHESASRPP